MKRRLSKIIFVISFVISSSAAFAQPGPPCGTPPCGGPGSNPGNPVPISGIEILLVAGAAFGAKKLLRKPKE